MNTNTNKNKWLLCIDNCSSISIETMTILFSPSNRSYLENRYLDISEHPDAGAGAPTRQNSGGGGLER